MTPHRTPGSALLALALALALSPLAACLGGSPAGGIHARMAYSEEGGLRVVDAPASGPAARAGVREGDRIVAIDGEPVDAMDMSEVVERLRGPAGSTVELEIARAGERLLLEVERAPYRSASR